MGKVMLPFYGFKWFLFYFVTDALNGFLKILNTEL